MNYPKEIKRVVFNTAIVAFGDALRYIGQNKAEDMIKAVHENEHYVSLTHRKDPKFSVVYIPMNNVNCIEYVDVKPEPQKSPRRPSSKV